MLGVDDDEDDVKIHKPRARSPPPQEKFEDLDDEEAALLRAFKRKSSDTKQTEQTLTTSKQPRITIDATPDL